MCEGTNFLTSETYQQVPAPLWTCDVIEHIVCTLNFTLGFRTTTTYSIVVVQTIHQTFESGKFINDIEAIDTFPFSYLYSLLNHLWLAILRRLLERDKSSNIRDCLYMTLTL